MVAPQTVIFSANRYKKNLFPHPTVQQRYQDTGASTILTAETGAITLFFDKNALRLAPSQ
jgi:beta-lactamase superfamily II metal-dependent hydrolase